MTDKQRDAKLIERAEKFAHDHGCGSIGRCNVCMAAFAAEVQREGDKWRLALESFTPQGSEYVNDLDACVAAVQRKFDSQHAVIKNKVRELAVARAEIERLKTERDDLAASVRAANACISPSPGTEALTEAADILNKAEAALRQGETNDR
jgi:ferredoxin